MGKKSGNANIEYTSIIQNWIDAAKDFEDDINFKELSRLSGKEIRRKMSAKKTDEGDRYVIRRRILSYDLYFFYNNPKKYYEEVFRLIKMMRYIIHDDNTVSKTITFTYPDNPDQQQMSFIHFVFNMIIWLPFFILDIPITKDSTFMPKVFNNKSYVAFVNTKIIEPYKHMVTHNEMSKMLAKMYDLFIVISEKYSLDLGLTFSMHSLITKWDNKEIYDLNHTKIPKNLQISEAEDYLNAKLKRYTDIMMDDNEDNILKPLLRSGQGANKKQLREFAIAEGYKPDIKGYTIPYAVNSCLLTNGLRKVADFADDAAGGRKSSVLALEIDNSGYLARTFSKSSSNIYLHPDPSYDCGSVNYYERKIVNKNDLSDMHGRWYLTSNNTLRQLTDHDYELIGETLKFRSPATCASKNGICKICYGHLYTQNLNINAGINSSLLLSERTYQNTMSAKHALDTDTMELTFSEDFYDFFELENGYRIRLRDDIEMPENYYLKINVNEIICDQDIQDLLDNEYITGFRLYDKEEEIEIVIDELKQNRIYLAEHLFSKIVKKRNSRDYDADGWILISLDTLSCEDDLAYAKLENDELTRPLKEVKSLIEKGKEVENVKNISDLINKLNTLMKQGGVFTQSVHIEILARNIIRDKNDIIKLPDYTKENPEYVITSIHNSILNSDSITTSLTFERIQSQLSSPVTYRKTGTSPLDPLFLLR